MLSAAIAPWRDRNSIGGRYAARMLVPAVMREALRTFGDRSDADFEAFPGGESNARTKWGEAFFAYVTTIAPPLPTAGVALAFRTKLRLARSFMPMPATTDLAAAWRAAMVSTSVAWDEPLFTLREQQLRTTLNALFASPTNNAFDRLDAIANAFHAATNLITTGGGAVAYS
jgi:hypothetical protein